MVLYWKLCLSPGVQYPWLFSILSSCSLFKVCQAISCAWPARPKAKLAVLCQFVCHQVFHDVFYDRPQYFTGNTSERDQFVISSLLPLWHYLENWIHNSLLPFSWNLLMTSAYFPRMGGGGVTRVYFPRYTPLKKQEQIINFLHKNYLRYSRSGSAFPMWS